MSKTCVNPVEVDDLLKPMLLKDLRIQCRARGLNPGGGRETLVERLRENILSSGDLCVLVGYSCKYAHGFCIYTCLSTFTAFWVNTEWERARDVKNKFQRFFFLRWASGGVVGWGGTRIVKRYIISNETE